MCAEICFGVRVIFGTLVRGGMGPTIYNEEASMRRTGAQPSAGKISTLIQISALLIAGGIGSASGQVDFTHDTGTVGVPGSGVNAAPGVANVYRADGVSNSQVVGLFGLGLIPGDHIDAFDRGDVAFNGSGVMQYSFLFSVEPGTVGEPTYPVWMESPTNAADMYALKSGVIGHELAYDEPGLGLLSVPAESIDGMTDAGVMPGMRVYFSLKSGSPTLLNNGWSGADVLSAKVGVLGSLARAYRATDLGLIPADELDGLALFNVSDVNDDGMMNDPFDGAIVYFSVDETSVGEIGSEVRQRSLTPAHHGGDIYMSGGVGGHTLLHKSDRRIRLGDFPVLDALKLGSTDMTDPFPMYGFGPGAPEPVKPASCPPYRGSGVPIGCFWVQVCDTPLPEHVNWEVILKICDANGNGYEVKKSGKLSGKSGANGADKVEAIAKAFEGLTFPKPGYDPDEITIFAEDGIEINMPPVNAPGRGIVGEVCLVVNQDLLDCGLNIDAICFSFSNWTAGIIPKEVKNWFPDIRRKPTLMVEGVAEHKGLLRVSATALLGKEPTPKSDMAFEVLVIPGQDGFSALVALTEQINEQGGLAYIDEHGALVIDALPIEPPVEPGGLGGPVVYEAGALGVPGLEITVGSMLARGPLSPCSPVDYAEPYGDLDFFDVSAFLDRFAKHIGDADLSYDGQFDFFDVSEFLDMYAAGCPGAFTDGDG